MNGIPALAQAVQSQGRNNDTQLVHMTPSEVQGLESLAMAYGGSLTTNPRTGLKEAGFLDNILPAIAGGFLAATGVGAPMAAMLVGGGTGLATGSLEKGLMAGLGAFGGAGIGSALAGTGAATAGAVPGAMPTTATPTVSSPVSAMASPEFGGALPAAPSVGTPITAPGGLSSSELLRGAQSATATSPAVAPTLNASALYGPSSAPTMSHQLAQAGQGITALGSEAGRSTFMNQIGGGMGLAKYGGAALAPALLSGEEGGPPPSTGTMRPYTYDPGRQTSQPGFQYRTGAPGESTAEQTYFTPSYTALPTYTPGSGSQAEQEDERRRMGIMSMAAGSEGPVRMLRGGGDATSDSMDGMIDEEEPVKLATGEVVIDGRAVSEIGNGDNEAGAKKIEAAIERIHKIRQKAKRGKPSPADKTFASMIA